MRNLQALLPQPAVILSRHASICLLLISSLSTAFGQTTYYVSNAGSDANTGRSSEAPFQTIAKINTLTLQPGDQVLFRRNDTFRGSLQLRQSGSSEKPIVVDAYGSGNKPVLSGAVAISNWTSLGNNRWQASCPDCGDRLTGLYRDNTALPLGRFPNLSATNKGYQIVQAHQGKNKLISQQPLTTDWTGGEVVFRPVQWILNRAIISNQTNNTLTLKESGTYDISDNWGYFIQNHPATLDQPGEWYYNPRNKTIQLYDNQTDPNTTLITATVFAEALNLANVSFVTIRNLQLAQSLATNLLITNSSNLTIAGNDIVQAGEDGFVARGNGQQILMENNRIEEVNNNGVDIERYQNITFRGNTLRRIGLIPGRGKSGDGTYVGFQSASTDNTLIENNVIDNIGYNALNFSSRTTIQRNHISNFCLTKSDGSGLYIWNGNRQPMSGIRLLSNVVYNGIGAPEGTPGGAYSGANGIYLDDCTTNIEVVGNSVYNCRGLGLYLHGSSNITVTGNTAYNNGEGQFAITSAGGCQPRTNVVRDNIFVSRLANQFNVKYESSQNDLVSFGQMDNNVYARPFEDTFKIRAVYNSTTGADLSISQWQNQYGKDLSTTNSPITYTSGSPDDHIRCIVNSTTDANRVTLEGTYRDARNKVYTDQVTVPAFSSMVLFKEITPLAVSLREADDPANPVAGLDYCYYEGSWNSLPNFATLSALRTGTNNLPNLALNSREDNFALRYTGYVRVPADGVYTFYTSSDDGSKLFIGSTEVVNNDGGHPEQERSGTIGLKAGLHALTVTYYEGGGGQALSVSYSASGVGKQVIPATALWRVATSQPSTGALREADNPANAVAGLDYSYYEGSWNSLPNFATLSALRTGTNNQPNLALNRREDNFALRYTGYVRVPADGVYTFYTSSDDGSKLFIGSTQVVDNDGSHPEQERSGTIGLKAGLHALTVVYYEGGGGQALTVSYSGMGVGKQVIPATALWRVMTSQPATGAPGRGAGLRAEYFNNKTLSAPALLTRTDATVDFDWGNSSPTPSLNVDDFTIRWTGKVEAPVTGIYAFSTNTDDGVRLWVNGTLVINDWNGHAPTTNTSTGITLTAGQLYDIRMEYFENVGGAVAKLLWAYPGQNQQIIPQARLFPASAPNERAAVVNEQEVDTVFMRVYPVPARESIWVQYNAKKAGEATVQLINTAAQSVYYRLHQVTPGENSIKVPVDQLNRGGYILTVTQGQERLSRKVLLTE